MIDQSLINPEFHLIAKDRDPSSLFASLSVFKCFNGANMFRYEERPPYPIINAKPTVRDLMMNINKSDVFLYFTIVGSGFLCSVAVTRVVNTLYLKFFAHACYMHCFNLWGIYMMFQCSYYRLSGLIDNGLRWKTKEQKLNKYDFTKEFEKQTIFKYFRERLD